MYKKPTGGVEYMGPSILKNALLDSVQYPKGEKNMGGAPGTPRRNKIASLHCIHLEFSGVGLFMA